MSSQSVTPASSVNAKLESLNRYFEAEIHEIDRHLVAYFERFDRPHAHYAMLRYHFGYANAELRALAPADYLSRGKRLRPIICQLFCRMYKLPPDVASVVMMATEIMHSASLAHDDIEDSDGVRWGRPTVQAAFGFEQGINVGDTLIGMVYHVLLTLRSQGVPPAVVVELIDVFNATHLRMCEGQHLDLRYRWFDDVSIPEYLDMVSRKTAAPCVCIAEAISMLASCSKDSRATLRQFGESLGLVYQICDDIRGIWCTPEALGRQIGQDVNQQRASLPLLYAFRHGSPELRDVLRQDSGRTEPLGEAEVAFIRRELTACGASQFCRDEATRHYQSAMDALAALQMECREIEVLRAILGAAFASVDFVV